jgi:signal transduction histidine kinase
MIATDETPPEHGRRDPEMDSESTLDGRRLRALIDAGQLVVSERELASVLDRLLEVARELTGARYAAIGVLDERRTGLADFLTAGIDEPTRQAIGDLPRGRGLLGTLILEPEPLRLDDVGLHPRSYGFPTGHPPMQTFLGVPILIRGEAWGNLYLTDKQTGPFDAADEEAAVVLAAWTAIAVENARLYRESERRSQQLSRSVRAMSATLEIGQAVGGETRLDRVLELIAERSRALVDASALAIVLVDGAEIVVAATAGDMPPRIVGLRAKADESVAGRVARTGRPERVSLVSRSLRFALRDLGVKVTSALFVPLMFRRRCVGVLEAFDRVGRPEFDAEDERVLQSAATSAAIAVATAQIVERDHLQRTLRAAEDERRRWARELHDETLQGLAGLRVLLTAARRSSDPQTLHRAIDDAAQQIAVEINNLRTLITELRPAALDELGLAPALDALHERATLIHGIEIEAEIDLAYEGGRHPERLDQELETVIYRVVQESLHNAGRHARANRARVTVQEHEAELIVCIGDDGDGFDLSQPTTGFGLAGMRERVTLVGGHLEVFSTSTGTEVQARLPITRVKRKSA